MISKETFIILVNGLIEYNDYKDKISTAIEQFIDGYAVPLQSPLEQAVEKVLEMEFGSDGADDVFCWLYDGPELRARGVDNVWYEVPTLEDEYLWLTGQYSLLNEAKNSK